MRPIVSVVVTPDGGDAFHLARAIESVLNQSLADLEVIATTAGDPSVEHVLAVFDEDPRFRGVSTGPDTCVARNEAVARAEGDFIAYIDAGSTWELHHLELMTDLVRDPATFGFSAYRAGGIVVDATEPAPGAITASNLVHRRTLLERHPGQRSSGWSSPAVDPAWELASSWLGAETGIASRCATVRIDGDAQVHDLPFSDATTADDPDVPTFVVVPCRNRADLTERFLDDLERDGSHRAAFVFDNGSTDRTWRLLQARRSERIRIFQRPAANIHHMWNEGWARAIDAAGPRCNVLFANNDVGFATGTISKLVHALRADRRRRAVYPSLAGEASTAARGGAEARTSLLGCFFMVRGEIAERFDEHFRFYYGDEDMGRRLLANDPDALAEVTSVAVTHVVAASTNWSPLFQLRIDRDRARFAERWEG